MEKVSWDGYKRLIKSEIFGTFEDKISDFGEFIKEDKPAYMPADSRHGLQSYSLEKVLEEKSGEEAKVTVFRRGLKFKLKSLLESAVYSEKQNKGDFKEYLDIVIDFLKEDKKMNARDIKALEKWALKEKSKLMPRLEKKN